MIVAVTGAEGFIGSGLVHALSTAGHSIRPLVRIGKGKFSNCTKTVEVDIATGEGLEGAFRGADVAIHLAARNIRREGLSTHLADEYRRVNVEGTRNVVRAARTAGVRLIIHASSTKAMGEESGTAFDEDSPCMPRTPYGISKLESERAVREEVTGSSMAAVILRLPQVYGAGVGGKFLRMLRWADRGRPFPIVRPERMRSILYLGNLGAGVVTLLGAPVPPISTYFLKDREDVSFRTLYSAICAGLGKTPRFIMVPSIGVWFGMILSENVRNIAGSLQVSSVKFEREVGFSPPHSFEQAISETVEWYKRSAR